MLGDEAWLAVCVPVHPRGVGLGRGQGSVKFFHTKLGKLFLYGDGDIVEGSPQTFGTKMEVDYYMNYQEI